MCQYISLIKFDKGKLFALECDRISFTREEMNKRLSVNCLYLAPLEDGHRPVDDWYLNRAGELAREFERTHH